MGRNSPHITTTATVLAAALLATLTACGTVSSFSKPDAGAATEADARNVNPDDPLARPTQVGWVSARATRCGFIFNAAQFRANYLSWESRTGHSPQQMKKIEEAYDYTRESVLEGANQDSRYCTKERLDATRVDLNRYLAGDYSPTSRLAR